MGRRQRFGDVAPAEGAEVVRERRRLEARGLRGAGLARGVARGFARRRVAERLREGLEGLGALRRGEVRGGVQRPDDRRPKD